MKASLIDIEQAIRANFVINPDGKILETGGDYLDLRLKSGARMVFIGIAMACGLRVDDIRKHLQMDIREFNNLLQKFYQCCDRGEEKVEERKSKGIKGYDQNDLFDIDLRIYRKKMLVLNYLYHFKRQRANIA